MSLTCRYFYPLTSPGIVVHEIAHAFTEYQSGLQYSGQSGAIDESYADMAGMSMWLQVNDNRFICSVMEFRKVL